MQIGLALPMAYYFHRATVVGLPANMLVVPLMELLMPAAVSAMALGYISQTLAKLPVLVAGGALEGIAGTVRWLGGLRVADLRVPTPGTALILLSARNQQQLTRGEQCAGTQRQHRQRNAAAGKALQPPCDHSKIEAKLHHRRGQNKVVGR